MSKQDSKVVVVTPVKNEAWILERFLSVTSQFADHIIIADQNSTDNSVEICKKYPKVTLINNESDQFDESSRQILLIQTARELVPEPRILLALDADEVLAANAMQTIGWQTMLKAEPGTVLYFEKPDLLGYRQQCVRYNDLYPLGYVDDGAEHKPRQIHSIRIPQPEYAPRLYIHDIKFLHYAFSRLELQESKTRFYSVVENISRTNHIFLRRFIYSSGGRRLIRGKIEEASEHWFDDWEKIGIDMRSIIHSKYYWQDFEVLRYFHKYGTWKFWLDDIWNFDWEACRVYATSIDITDIPKLPICIPPRIIILLLKTLDILYEKISYLKNSF